MSQEFSILDNAITNDDGNLIVFFAGGGMCVAVEMTPEEVEATKKLRKDDRIMFIKKTLKEGWERTKGLLGYCRLKKIEVKVLDCVRCGPKERGFKTKQAWEMCIRQHVL